MKAHGFLCGDASVVFSPLCVWGTRLLVDLLVCLVLPSGIN